MKQTSSVRHDGTKRSRYRVEGGRVVIDLKVRNLRQLFDFRDPAPFRERDLAEKAAEYIVSAAEEIGYKEPLKIVIHYIADVEDEFIEAEVENAFHSYFEYEAKILHRKVSLAFQHGRMFLAIGITVLAVLLTLAEAVSKSYLPMRSLFEEGLIITGWVAMWKPLDTFLYGWWPIKQKEKYYIKLSRTEVILVSEPEENEI